jgi:hypothetical protein
VKSTSTTPRWETRLQRWLSPQAFDRVQRPEGAFERRVVAPMRDFVGAVLRQAPRPEIAAQRRVAASPRLRFDVHLALASRSVRLFEAGPVDELAFVQRQGVSLRHDVEFLTRLAPEARGGEDYEAYGVVRLYRRGRPLPRLELARAFWSSLEDDFGLSALPAAADLLVSQGPAVSPGRRGPPKEEHFAVVAPRAARVYQRVGMRRHFYGDVLALLRDRLTPTQKIAWIEEAFARAPSPGEVVHRYYLMGGTQLHLVRHHWSAGRVAFQAETSAEARRLCLESGVFRRLRRAA